MHVYTYENESLQVEMNLEFLTFLQAYVVIKDHLIMTCGYYYMRWSCLLLYGNRM